MRTLTIVMAVAVGAALACGPVAAQPSDAESAPDAGVMSNLYGSLTDALDVHLPGPVARDSLGQALDSGPVGFGLSVMPRRPALELDPAARDNAAATSVAYRLADTRLKTTEIGVDLRISWPSGASDDTASPLGAMRPYLSVGPAMFVGVADDATALGSALVRQDRDSTMSLGMRGALGVVWQVTRDASMFGEYRLTQDRAFGARTSGDTTGVDLFYGFSLRF